MQGRLNKDFQDTLFQTVTCLFVFVVKRVKKVSAHSSFLVLQSEHGLSLSMEADNFLLHLTQPHKLCFSWMLNFMVTPGEKR